MKAVIISEFGGTEVLKIQETELPIPMDDEILVKVFASGVNPVDGVIRNGGNDLLRPLLKLPLILGCDAAGIVEEVGTNVTSFKKGDEVFGCPNFPGNGSYAEFVAARATQFAFKPKNISFVWKDLVSFFSGLVLFSTIILPFFASESSKYISKSQSSSGLSSYLIKHSLDSYLLSITLRILLCLGIYFLFN